MAAIFDPKYLQELVNISLISTIVKLYGIFSEVINLATYQSKGLADLWVTEIKELEKLNFDTEIYLRLCDLIAVINTSEILVDKFTSRKRLVSKTKTLQFISHYYFAHSYHLILSIYHLCKLNFGSASLILVRSLVEACIDFSYLWLCKKISGTDDERTAWGAYGFIRRKSIDSKWEEMQNHRDSLNLPKVKPDHLFEQIQSQKLLQEVDNFKNRYHRNHWAKISALDKRARAVDDTLILSQAIGVDLEQVYTMVYKWTSELVHSESAGSDSYIHKHKEGFIIDFGPSGLNVNMAIPMAIQVFIATLHIFNHINRLEIDLIEEAKASGCKIFT